MEVSCDKEDTHHILKDLGLPVPQQIVVYNERQCQRAARRIGYPVVVKPLDANHGRGVSINLLEDDQVQVAYGFRGPRKRTPAGAACWWKVLYRRI